jgi:flavodoxin
MVNALVVYFSKFGNTQMVAEAIAKVFESVGSARLLSSDQLEASDLEGSDLVVMGSPTHKMNLPESVRPVFERLPKRVLRGKNVAAFDTSYKMSSMMARFTAAKKLVQKLRKLGGKRVVPPETFFVMAREGPLFDGEIERAAVWANTILGQLDDQGS